VIAYRGPVPAKVDARPAVKLSARPQFSKAVLVAPDVRLRRIAERLGELPDGGGEDGLWFAGALAEAGDDPDGKTTAVALGLLRRRGQHRFETIIAAAERDAGIRDLAHRYYTGLEGRSLARAVMMAIRRYAAVGWLIDQNRNQPTSDPMRAILYRIVASDPECKFSFGTVRRGLGHI